MNWRRFELVRAGAVAAFLASVVTLTANAQEPVEPVPGADFIAHSVDLLKAQRDGQLAVDARGAGDDQVKLHIQNISGRRLQVIIPSGLVASAATGQGAFQSMGIGRLSNHDEAFGAFERSDSSESAGFRSVGIADAPDAESVAIAGGQEVTILLPAVCLNLGLPDPKPTDRFELMDVSEYSNDERVQKALRSLGNLGTGRRVAQVVMWHVCNNYSLEQIARLAPQIANQWEFALADRFVEALDASVGTEVVDPAYLQEGRIFVRVQGDAQIAEEVDRLATELDGAWILGLRARALQNEYAPKTSGPALYLIVTLNAGADTVTAGRVAVHGSARDAEWQNGGVAKFVAERPLNEIDGLELADELERAIANKFVKVRPNRRTKGGLVYRLSNGLPLTIAHLTIDPNGDGTSLLSVESIGIAPLRTAEVTVPSETLLIERLELNGL